MLYHLNEFMKILLTVAGTENYRKGGNGSRKRLIFSDTLIDLEGLLVEK